MEKLYCTIFIVDISQNPEEVETVTSRIEQLIEDYGGIIQRVNRWGKRRLAYPINKKTHGFYVEVEFKANSRLNIPSILEQEYRMNDRVLRYLTYVVDKKELLQRARKAGEKAEVKKEAPPSPTAEEKPPVVETTSTEIPEEEKKEVPEETVNAGSTPAPEKEQENKKEGE